MFPTNPRYLTRTVTSRRARNDASVKRKNTPRAVRMPRAARMPCNCNP